MILEVKRFEFDENYTIGKLYVDGKYLCYTLEDAVRDTKIQDKTAIPEGTYKVVMSWSPRFKRVLPLIENVPNFKGVRIHPGNTSKDTEGCILVGKEWTGGDFIGRSRDAFAELFHKLEFFGDDITLNIK